jgi:hypothetical protein
VTRQIGPSTPNQPKKGEYHVTDPQGNHYNYTRQHVRNGADGIGDKWKGADAFVSRIFGVTPTFEKVLEYNKALLALIQEKRFAERTILEKA